MSRTGYNKEAVAKQIEADRRAGRKISTKEATLIHRLMEGRQPKRSCGHHLDEIYSADND